MRLLLIFCFIFCSACQRKLTENLPEKTENQISQINSSFPVLEKKEKEMDRVWTELKKIVRSELENRSTRKKERPSNQNKEWKHLLKSLSPAQKKKWDKMNIILANAALTKGTKQKHLSREFIKAHAEFYKTLAPEQRKIWDQEMQKTKTTTTPESMEHFKKWIEVMKAITAVDEALSKYRKARVEWEKSMQE